MPQLASNSLLLGQAFKNLPVRFRIVQGGQRGTDLIIRAGNVRYTFEVKLAGEGWPSDVQQVLAGIPKKWPRDLIVIARRFSPGSLELLRSRDANWADAVGNVHVHTPPGLLVDRFAPPSYSPKRNGLMWNPSSLDIAEGLLSEPSEQIRVSKLARDAGWSSARITSILRSFDAMGWTSRHGGKQGQGVWRELAKPGSMLEAWTEQVSRLHFPSRSTHALMPDPIAYLREHIAPVLKQGVEWALTTWAAASMLAPYAAFVPVLHVYVRDEFLRDQRFESTIKAAGLREVDEGANVVFRGANPRLFRHALRRDIPLASIPRVYADLMSLGDRAADVARHLRETLLEY